jgi:hypothetical protein
MSTIERDLVRAINSGRCFVLVGSGASCEIRLPTWHSLSEKTFQYFKGRIDKKKRK